MKHRRKGSAGMKKLLAMILCLAMTMLLLVGCVEDEIGGDLDGYKDKYSPSLRKNIELDFYIVYEEGTTENAIVTVERMINSHLSDQYKTTLDMHYLTMDEYEETVLADVQKTGEDRADIVLVIGKDMFDALYSDHALANLSVSPKQLGGDGSGFLGTTKYGKLNTQISTTLLNASLIKEQRTTYQDVPYDVYNRYTIPNNHVIGSYEYVLINKEAARAVNFGNDKLSAMLTYESTEELRAALASYGVYDVDECVKVAVGMYSDKALYESQGYFCNISRYPTVDAEEAFLSSFAIVRAENDLSYLETKDPSPKDEGIVKDTSYLDHYDRCMEVIYALNTDVYFRNLIMYGVKGTNHSVDDNGSIVPYTDGPGVYNMNLLYTGDVFKANFCEVMNWNSAAKLNGEEQNKQSVVADAENE